VTTLSGGITFLGHFDFRNLNGFEGLQLDTRLHYAGS